MDNRVSIDDNLLEDVVGGLFTWHKKSLILDYKHDNGSTTYHRILNLQKGWELSNQMHSKLIPEDQILAELIKQHYIEG